MKNLTTISFYQNVGILSSLFILLFLYQNCSNMKFTQGESESLQDCKENQVPTIDNSCVSKENTCEVNGRHLKIGDIVNVCETEIAPENGTCRCDNVTCTPDKILTGPSNYKYFSCSNSGSIQNGICGASSLSYFSDIPKDNFCDAGSLDGSVMPTPEGAWAWKCKSLSQNGKNVDCMSLPLADIAKCGVANNQTYSHTPDASLLCLKSNIVDTYKPFTGDWNWRCISRGDSNIFIECSAKIDSNKIDAKCGPISTDTNISVSENQCPSANYESTMCSPGRLDSSSCLKSSDGSKWQWTCLGLNKGNNSETCSVKISASISSCGSDNNGYFDIQPINLCYKMEPPKVPIKLEKNIWTWTCGKESCEAYKKINGVCAEFISPIATIPPEGELCQSGIATKIITTTNPITWTCKGSQNGTSTNCQVQIVPPPNCGDDHNLNFDEGTPPQKLCSQGIQSANFKFNISDNTWTWTCSDKSCLAYKKINGVCVDYKGVPQTKMPNNPTGLCVSGTSPGANQNGNYYVWDCLGSKDGTNQLNCSAPLLPAPSCGTSASPSVTEPITNKCSDGSSGSVSNYNSSDDSWNWTCSTYSCKALKIVNGECQSYSGQTPPSTTLQMCKVGLSNCPLGGCWSWICIGKNGGSNPSCVGNQLACSNGALNYPTCTTNSSGLCINGMENPPICNQVSGKKWFLFGGETYCTTPSQVSNFGPLCVGTPVVGSNCSFTDNTLSSGSNVCFTRFVRTGCGASAPYGWYHYQCR